MERFALIAGFLVACGGPQQRELQSPDHAPAPADAGATESSDGGAVDAGSFEAGTKRDRDGDGVADECDSCPDAWGGEDDDGCPTLQTDESVAHFIESVRFQKNSVKEVTDTAAFYDVVAHALDGGNIKKLAVLGYADPDEKDVLRISTQRAEHVVAELTKRGVAKAMLEAHGLGSEIPRESGPRMLVLFETMADYRGIYKHWSNGKLVACFPNDPSPDCRVLRRRRPNRLCIDGGTISR